MVDVEGAGDIEVEDRGDCWRDFAVVGGAACNVWSLGVDRDDQVGEFEAFGQFARAGFGVVHLTGDAEDEEEEGKDGPHDGASGVDWRFLVLRIYERREANVVHLCVVRRHCLMATDDEKA